MQQTASQQMFAQMKKKFARGMAPGVQDVESLEKVDVDMAHSPERPASPTIKSSRSTDAAQMHDVQTSSPRPAPPPSRADVESASASTPENDTGARVHANRPLHHSDVTNLAKANATAMEQARNFKPAALSPVQTQAGTVDEIKLEDGWTQLPRQWELSDFQPIEKLYRGYASKVYLAKDNGKIKLRGPNGEEKVILGTGQLVVLKVYDLLRLSPLTTYQLEREVRLHGSVKHDNIVNLIAAFTQSDFRILVQTYAQGGDLYNYLRKQRVRLSEKKLVRMVLQPCLSALSYLHSKGLVHRDIKPENLLLDHDKVIKLADFGLSININEEAAVTRAGTLDYMAPEVLVCPLKRLPSDYKDNATLAYTSKVDSWSMGVLAYELMTGHSPYQQRDEKALLFAIGNATVTFPPSISALAKDWVTIALEKDAARRASVADLMSHPWIVAHSRRSSSLVSTGSLSLTSDEDRTCHTPSAYGQGHMELERAVGAACYGEDQKKKSSLSPAIMGITLQDGSNTPTGCRSPAALHMTPEGNTPVFGHVRASGHTRLPNSPLSRASADDTALPRSKLAMPVQMSNVAK